ncbi:hypothetical protein Tco_0804121 [Tanacetum coccineum]|uniref:Ubiquitinyl hydrolase 1 n=1 Tax=Tanacetum coccineum TaxID=301880 RepID=A0ABQ5A551_9ASTR
MSSSFDPKTALNDCVVILVVVYSVLFLEFEDVEDRGVTGLRSLGLCVGSRTGRVEEDCMFDGAIRSLSFGADSSYLKYGEQPHEVLTDFAILAIFRRNHYFVLKLLRNVKQPVI